MPFKLEQLNVALSVFIEFYSSALLEVWVWVERMFWGMVLLLRKGVELFGVVVGGVRW